MQAYRVIAPFIFRNQTVAAQPEWTPPNQAIADKLLAAGCLRVRSAAAAVPVEAPSVRGDTIENPINAASAPDEVPEADAVEESTTEDSPESAKKGRWGRGTKSRGK